jgi:hypothetical protein
MGLPEGLRICVAVEPVDMRKQYDELRAMADILLSCLSFCFL